MKQNGSTVSNRLSLGYGIGVYGEGIGYNVFYSFFVYFLVDIAGINPALAGTVSLLAVMWDAFTDPMVGYFSDHTRNPKGRRRPVMFKGCFLWAIAIALMFRDVPLTGSTKAVYYIALNVLFWLAGTMCVIPHSSLGADLTDDYNGRNKLRSFAAFGLNAGQLTACGATLMLVAFFQKMTGGSEATGWAWLGMTYGLIVVVVYLISYFCTAGKEKPNPNVGQVSTEKFSLVKVFKEYFETLNNGPFRLLLIATLLENFEVGVYSSLNVYMYSELYGFNDATSSLMYTINGVGLVAFTVVNGYLANKIGKKATMVLGLSVQSCAFLVLLIMPFTYITAVVSALLAAFGSSAYWTLLYSMCYDCGIVAMLKSGQSKEGLYTSAIGFFMKLGTSIGMWLVGIGLTMIGYNADIAAQSAATLDGLRMMYIWPNALVLLIAAAVMLKYGMTQNAYNTLNDAYQKKLNNENYDLGEYEYMVR